ncbi:hypothetical protein ACFXPV_18075 [Streptomyces sp. NPDC059118]|uniref:hypothetical protein n=1 Tax=unclassified Streptomyces TaxID=2593676 RepID=UPI0036A389AB
MDQQSPPGHEGRDEDRGQGHDRNHDIRRTTDELRDVIVTATVALRALTPGAAAVLARHVRGVTARPHTPRSPRPGQESRGMAGRQRVAE